MNIKKIFCKLLHKNSFRSPDPTYCHLCGAYFGYDSFTAKLYKRRGNIP